MTCRYDDILSFWHTRLIEWQELIVLKSSIATFTTIVISAYTAVEQIAHILFLLMVIDFILGFGRAWHNGLVSSAGCFKGVLKFALYMLAILVVSLTAQALNMSAGSTFQIDVWFICVMCMNESLSCLSHLSRLGFPVPLWLIEKLKSFHDDPSQMGKKL